MYENKSEVKISGEVSLKIDVENKADSFDAKSWGIYAKENVSVLGSASLDIKSATHAQRQGAATGIYSSNGIAVFNTTGDVTIDCSDAANHGGGAIGNPSYIENKLIKVGTLTLKFDEDGYPYFGGSDGMDYDKNSFAFNRGEMNGVSIERYKFGAPKNLEIENGLNEFGNDEGQYIEGESVTIAANGIAGLSFAEWASDHDGFNGAGSSPFTFNMPGKDVIIMAKYNAFDLQPSFAHYDESHGTISFIIKSKTPEFEAPRLIQGGDHSYVVGDNVYSGDSMLYSAVVKDTEGNPSAVKNGSYRIAVKIGGLWHYSELFSVNYQDKLRLIGASGSLNKNSYEWDEPVDLAGIKVSAIYASGAEADITAFVTADPLNVGDTKVTLHYGNQSCNVEGITVRPKTIEGHDITKNLRAGTTAAQSVNASDFGITEA